MKSLLLCVCLCITQVLSSQNLVSVNIDPTSTPKGKLMLGDLVEFPNLRRKNTRVSSKS